MSAPIVITVPGKPVPQGSHVVRRGRVVADNEAELNQWRKDIGKVALAAMRGRKPFDAAMRLEASFRFPKPKRTKFGDHPAGAPDVDKCLRAVFDALTGIVYTDDARVVCVAASKTWGEPGCVIRLSPVGGAA